MHVCLYFWTHIAGKDMIGTLMVALSFLLHQTMNSNHGVYECCCVNESESFFLIPVVVGEDLLTFQHMDCIVKPKMHERFSYYINNNFFVM